MPTLSIVMIVKNEEHCLGACLDSVRPIADEILVGDTGSEDGTVAVARDAGARVLHLPWRDDFAEARNAVLEQATGDWLLHMDADEALDSDGARRIRALVDADGAGADAVELTLANYCDEPRAWRWVPSRPGDPWAKGWSGYLAVPLLRLFRNGLGYEYREPVHENITASVLEHGGVLGRADILIHHYGYAADPVKSRNKARLYFQIARRKTLDQPQDPKAWHDLAEQALACGEQDDAEQACRRALQLEPGHVGAAMTLANLLLLRGATDAVPALLAPFIKTPSTSEEARAARPLMLVALGAVDAHEGKLEDARRRFEEALTAEPPPVMAMLELARVHDLAGRTGAARASLQHAAALAPNLAEVRDRREAFELRCEAETLFARKQPAEALARLVRAVQLDPRDPVLQNDLGMVLRALGEADRARRAFGRATALAPAFAAARANLEQMR